MTKEEVESFDRWLKDNAELIVRNTSPESVERLWLEPTPNGRKFLYTIRNRRTFDSDESPSPMNTVFTDADTPVLTLNLLGKYVSPDEVRPLLEKWGWGTEEIDALLRRAEQQ